MFEAKTRVLLAIGVLATAALFSASANAGTASLVGALVYHSGTNGYVSLSVIQRMLRHSKPATTAIYTHRTNAVQMAAQAKFLEAIKVTTAPV